MDFGAGLGPFSHAMSEYHAGCEVASVEPNEFMRNLGIFLGNKNEKMSFHKSLQDGVYASESDFYDLINCSFVLEEIPTPE